MILICSSPLIAAKVTIAWITVGFNDVFARHRPPEILAVVESLLINMPVLILDGVEFAPLVLASDLTKGCPASCMLYIIGVDPLLSSLQQTPQISGVSGFVDDWSMGCHGLPAISAVSNLIHNFEQASGQQINRGKYALIPARQLSDVERASCLPIWNSDIRISSRERVLGVFIGIHVSIHKFDMALSVFGRVKTSLSLAMRVLVVNIFMFTIFSNPNRQFFMPRVLLQEIERKVLRFLASRVTTFQCRWCVVHSRSFERHSPWYDLCIGTVATTTHISSQPCHQLEGCVRLSAYSRHYTFRNPVRSWSSSS